jgi:N-methylhydantoinase A/oxoprolinase/acetone carboxylase beta subunit
VAAVAGRLIRLWAVRAEIASRLSRSNWFKEVDERVTADGRVSRDLDEETVRRAAREFRTGGIATIAVSLLHSYANPAHELRVKQILSEEMAGAQVMLSSEISRRAAEYARTATTSANAALKSLMTAYIADLTRPGALQNRTALRCSLDGYAGERRLD